MSEAFRKDSSSPEVVFWRDKSGGLNKRHGAGGAGGPGADAGIERWESIFDMRQHPVVFFRGTSPAKHRPVVSK